MDTKIIIGIFLFAFSAHAIAADCTPTPHRTTGTHYKPVTMERTDVSKGVVVKGQIFSAPDCKPVVNAKVAHWQAGEQGRYLDRLRAYLFTDASGRYRFETEWPNMQTPHIHFIVTADRYNTLETQWVGDERQKEIVFNMVLKSDAYKKSPALRGFLPDSLSLCLLRKGQQNHRQLLSAHP